MAKNAKKSGNFVGPEKWEPCQCKWALKRRNGNAGITNLSKPQQSTKESKLTSVVANLILTVDI